MTILRFCIKYMSVTIKIGSSQFQDLTNSVFIDKSKTSSACWAMVKSTLQNSKYSKTVFSEWFLLLFSQKTPHKMSVTQKFPSHQFCFWEKIQIQNEALWFILFLNWFWTSSQCFYFPSEAGWDAAILVDKAGMVSKETLDLKASG